MFGRKEILTALIVTLVAALIWAWAASETREGRRIDTARLSFNVDEPANWIIKPATASPTVYLEGTKVSVEQAVDEFRRTIPISVPVNETPITIDLAAALRENETIAKTGARIVSTEPKTILLELDPVVRLKVPVTPALPGVTPEGEIIVQPREVTVSLPRSVSQRLRSDFTVEAFLDRGELDMLEPGVPQSLDLQVRAPELLDLGDDLHITPSTVKVHFTIRSRIRETTIDSMRVQVAGPPEDRDSFAIDMEPKILRTVTVLANADLSRLIESGEVPVVAVVHLSSREKEARIDRKAVSYFLALIPEVDGSTRYEQLPAPSGVEMPVVNLTITMREPEALE